MVAAHHVVAGQPRERVQQQRRDLHLQIWGDMGRYSAAISTCTRRARGIRSRLGLGVGVGEGGGIS